MPSSAPSPGPRRAAFLRDGFVVHPEPLVPPALVREAVVGMDAVLSGSYASAPRAGFERRDPISPAGLVKIDQAHVVDPTLFAVATHPAIGALAAEVLDAHSVQLWATQLLHKPGGGAATAAVGWHQDLQYWSSWWSGETFTIWLALADVDEDMGPLSYVRGSHLGGLLDGDFFDSDLTGLADRIGGTGWHEVPAVLRAGGVSLHHHLTLHGSHANASDRPRRGMALHLRTERATPRPDGDHPYGPDWLTDETVSPYVWPAAN